MAGGLIDFLIAVLVICLLCGMLFVALPRISPDPAFTKIGQLAIGGIAVIILIEAVAHAFFGGGAAAGGAGLNAGGLIAFAIALIVIMIVVFVLYLAVDKLLPAYAPLIKYVVGGLALIGILVAANVALFGGAIPNLGAAGTRRGDLLFLDAPYLLGIA